MGSRRNRKLHRAPKCCCRQQPAKVLAPVLLLRCNETLFNFTRDSLHEDHCTPPLFLRHPQRHADCGHGADGRFRRTGPGHRLAPPPLPPPPRPPPPPAPPPHPPPPARPSSAPTPTATASSAPRRPRLCPPSAAASSNSTRTATASSRAQNSTKAPSPDAAPPSLTGT